jgi:hypothetical protein
MINDNTKLLRLTYVLQSLIYIIVIVIDRSYMVFVSIDRSYTVLCILMVFNYQFWKR